MGGAAYPAGQNTRASYGDKGLNPADLAPALPRSRASEILSGERGVSEIQARDIG